LASTRNNIQMNVGSCHPHMWGFMWGYGRKMPGNQKPCTTIDEMLFLDRATCGAIEWLDQIQFGCPFDSRPAIIDIEFTVDTLGMCAYRAQGDHEFTGDLGPQKVGFE
jgi:hypothetical protein